MSAIGSYSSGRLRQGAAVVAAAALVIACGGLGGATPAAPTLAATQEAAATANATPAPTAVSMVFDDDVKVAEDGRSVHMSCWGSGEPIVLLEAGYPSAGLTQFGYAGSFLSLLAADRRVCAYDRAGNGRSDPAPREPRDLDDVTDDLHAVLDGVDHEGPVVLVGSSGGGNIVVHYAHRFPGDVLAVVMLDVPAPQASLTLEEAPELAWDAPENPEHVDIVPEVENRQATERLPFAAPLLVITATDGQSDVADQSFWLAWSDKSRQIELQGSHEVYLGSPGEIAAAILALPDLGE